MILKTQVNILLRQCFLKGVILLLTQASKINRFVLLGLLKGKG
jgi:hypothetical protein